MPLACSSKLRNDGASNHDFLTILARLFPFSPPYRKQNSIRFLHGLLRSKTVQVFSPQVILSLNRAADWKPVLFCFSASCYRFGLQTSAEGAGAEKGKSRSFGQQSLEPQGFNIIRLVAFYLKNSQFVFLHAVI